MSRTRNTAPFDVQARWLPAWTVREWHTRGCTHGTTACTIDDPREPRTAHEVRCWRTVRYYGGAAGGSRDRQSLCADLAEGAARTRLRAQLRDSVKVANTALRDGDVGTLDGLDIDAAPESIAWMLH